MLSVIVPTHNRCEYAICLANTLDDQEFSEPVQLIFILDNCTDNTLVSLKNLKLKNPLVIHTLNKNSVAAARNKGADLAIGEYLLFLDDDVIPQNGLINAHLRCHNYNINKQYAFIGPYPVAPDAPCNALGIGIKEWWDKFFKTISDPDRKFIYTDFVTGNFSIQKDHFNLLGGFNENFKNAGGEDFEFGIRLIKSGFKIKFVKDAIAYHYPDFNPKSLLSKSYLYGLTDAYMSKKYPEYFWPVNIKRLKRFGFKHRALFELIRLIGIKKIINLTGNFFNKRIGLLWNSKYLKYYRFIDIMIYKFGIFLAIGEFKQWNQNINKYCDIEQS